ncbi:MAG: DUF5060 domain-containing protein [Bacteroidota bacterium]
MRYYSFLNLLLLVGWVTACQPTEEPKSLPTYQQWHKVTLSFEGPETSEDAEENPFTNYRLIVTFRNGDQSYDVPGFYAADGNAAESGASSGNVWQVHFAPDTEGEWTYQASFRKGDNIAISTDANAGEPIAFDGEQGSFQVVASDKQGKDFRAKGKLKYAGERYLKFAGTDEYYLKGGAGSPENLLGYVDFDGTEFGGEEGHKEGEAPVDKELHVYEDHVKDWNEGDPSWQNGKGKGIIGGLNYLAGKGMNSLYFLTMNIEGDGEDVWPYTNYEERYRFDCSKLDQWETVFSHADSLGILLHFFTQETENELLLDNGDLGPQRQLYYRELIARFAHHLGVAWNMGEENGYAEFSPESQNDDQRRAMISYFKETDPYQNFVALHTHAAQKERDEILEPLLGYEDLDGPSLQIGGSSQVHEETKRWISESGEAGKQWVVNLDEIGPYYHGVLPDDVDPEHDTIRYEVLWGNLMAGGGGAEWYFGYLFGNSDLGLETWRTRNNMWDQTRYAVSFFHDNLPFWEMETADDLVDAEGAYCFAKPGEVYAIYLYQATTTNLNLEDGNYSVQWFDPENGGDLQNGSVSEVSGGSSVSVGNAPSGGDEDWVVLVRSQDG